ncbi:Uncharacterised protein [Legionella israelensis]|uniref:Uncharacterized protein n=1 Tax=Legionella israelensis TaxID=454 RepID=A0A0W0W544_9GAMM|nr:hypothetical protein [Legionella israelensis]KTD27480.1 hypothetical protein Lisr_0997 [Legionella israelensis]SCY44653.1 hypothetical protein SAMN02746069_02481 [Legionella israelensis DSM 19235]STX57458.1 Uncharacterised protein [Legionella israelensis]
MPEGWYPREDIEGLFTSTHTRLNNPVGNVISGTYQTIDLRAIGRGQWSLVQQQFGYNVHNHTFSPSAPPPDDESYSYFYTEPSAPPETVYSIEGLSSSKGQARHTSKKLKKQSGNTVPKIMAGAKFPQSSHPPYPIYKYKNSEVNTFTILAKTSGAASNSALNEALSNNQGLLADLGKLRIRIDSDSSRYQKEPGWILCFAVDKRDDRVEGQQEKIDWIRAYCDITAHQFKEFANQLGLDATFFKDAEGTCFAHGEKYSVESACVKINDFVSLDQLQPLLLWLIYKNLYSREDATKVFEDYKNALGQQQIPTPDWTNLLNQLSWKEYALEKLDALIKELKSETKGLKGFFLPNQERKEFKIMYLEALHDAVNHADENEPFNDILNSVNDSKKDIKASALKGTFSHRVRDVIKDIQNYASGNWTKDKKAAEPPYPGPAGYKRI